MCGVRVFVCIARERPEKDKNLLRTYCSSVKLEGEGNCKKGEQEVSGRGRLMFCGAIPGDSVCMSIALLRAV